MEIKFINMLTAAHHWTLYLYSARWSQSAPSEIIYITFALILSFQLCVILRNMFFPSGSLTKILPTGLTRCVHTSAQ
jgi:hypothetical protein